jgi:hypothetical protein
VEVPPTVSQCAHGGDRRRESSITLRQILSRQRQSILMLCESEKLCFLIIQLHAVYMPFAPRYTERRAEHAVCCVLCRCVYVCTRIRVLHCPPFLSLSVPETWYFRLEDQVPENHLLRLIEKHVRFDFVRAKLQDSYSDTGRPSIDPSCCCASF